jgi:hypothetical protein
MLEMEWVLLGNFEAQTEARVVESFLRAQGLEVQLLDTYMQALLPLRGLGPGSGMRLMVRRSDLEAARELLVKVENAARLSVVQEQEEPSPTALAKAKPAFQRSKRFIVILLILAALIVAAGAVVI